ncbi:hypothetical protein HON22_00025, partial [Candidatus Peregrinibacteria bacterium]|nr:hypothetical protein [Candidatus Peregrinibacteria bacterium]
KQLEEANIKIDLITGTSMGAVIAACIASGMGHKDMIKILEDMAWLKLIGKPVKGSFMDGRNAKKYLESIFGDKKIEDLKIPFACIATDIDSGEEIVINKGKITDALRATTSIPCIFEPYYYQERYLADGGLTNNLPILLAEQMGAKKILAINVLPPRNKKTLYTQFREEKPDSFFEKIINHITNPGIKFFHNFLEKTFAIMHAQIEEKQKNVLKDTKLYCKHVDLTGFSLGDFLKWKKIVACGNTTDIQSFINSQSKAECKNV